ncbi:MAG: malate dehydrogenase [Chlamydiae bacterium]|nr:malate dehydrogenase [Chlamydiota bacterium]
MKRVVVTGGGGRVAYGLHFMLADGDLFGPDEQIALHIYDLPEMQGVIEAVAMELEDCAFPLLHEIKVGSDLNQMFEDVDCAFLVGAKPRGPGMERADLLLENGKIFIDVGRALNESAKPDVKVLTCGNPCNTNCLIAMSHAPKIPRKNFHALMRLDHNRAQSILAKKAGVEISSVNQVIIWGNHSATQVPDYTHVLLEGKEAEKSIDSSWLSDEFMRKVQTRGSAIIKASGKSSAASAAKASIDAMRALFFPTPDGEWFTSGVCSNGNTYGIEENLIFGFPCFSKESGEYEIVPNLSWNALIKEKIALTQKEWISKREGVKEILRKL